jgi:hypothetical protein
MVLFQRNGSEDGMDHLTSILVADRIQRFEREAAAERLARATSERTRAAWRRFAGDTARRLSARLDEVASQLDPASCRPSYGRE